MINYYFKHPLQIQGQIIEITKQLKLSEQERNYVEMHSVLNVLNILTYEIVQLGEYINDEDALSPSLNFIQELASSLTNKDKTMKLLRNINEKKEEIIANAEEAEKVHAEADDLDEEARSQIKKSLENIYSLLDIFEIRAAEIIIRERRAKAWLNHSITELNKRFAEVLEAIEKNSKGRYRIATDEGEQDDRSYLVHLSFHSEQGDRIYMPPELQDVLRDLIANARKYTDIGGRIHASLSQSDSELEIMVEDDGRGIPEDQIESSIEYGFRGANAQDKQIYGGGFGLTKAYYITKRYNGRMWIDSAVGKGTKITIRIPLP